MDDMIALAKLVDPEIRPRYYQRIAEIALFLSGIFPDRPACVAARTRSTLTTERTLRDYEQEGQRFYALAASEISEAGLHTVLDTLANKFVLARSAFNSLRDRYLREQRGRLFGSELHSESVE
jgi:hypothetical protein